MLVIELRNEIVSLRADLRAQTAAADSLRAEQFPLVEQISRLLTSLLQSFSSPKSDLLTTAPTQATPSSSTSAAPPPVASPTRPSHFGPCDSSSPTESVCINVDRLTSHPDADPEPLPSDVAVPYPCSSSKDSHDLISSSAVLLKEPFFSGSDSSIAPISGVFPTIASLSPVEDGDASPADPPISQSPSPTVLLKEPFFSDLVMPLSPILGGNSPIEKLSPVEDGGATPVAPPACLSSSPTVLLKEPFFSSSGCDQPIPPHSDYSIPLAPISSVEIVSGTSSVLPVSRPSSPTVLLKEPFFSCSDPLNSPPIGLLVAPTSSSDLVASECSPLSIGCTPISPNSSNAAASLLDSCTSSFSRKPTTPRRRVLSQRGLLHVVFKDLCEDVPISAIRHELESLHGLSICRIKRLAKSNSATYGPSLVFVELSDSLSNRHILSIPSILGRPTTVELFRPGARRGASPCAASVPPSSPTPCASLPSLVSDPPSSPVPADLPPTATHLWFEIKNLKAQHLQLQLIVLDLLNASRIPTWTSPPIST